MLISVCSVGCLCDWLVFLVSVQPIDSNQLKLLIPVAVCHALGHVTSNVSFAAVAVSFTHTIKGERTNLMLSYVWYNDQNCSIAHLIIAFWHWICLLQLLSHSSMPLLRNLYSDNQSPCLYGCPWLLLFLVCSSLYVHPVVAIILLKTMENVNHADTQKLWAMRIYSDCLCSLSIYVLLKWRCVDGIADWVVIQLDWLH